MKKQRSINWGRILIGFAIGCLVMILVLSASCTPDSGSPMPLGQPREYAISDLELVGCEESVCVYNFPSHGRICYLAVGVGNRRSDTWMFDLECD